MRLMYDSVNPPAIPANAAMVAGYINGPYAWTRSEWNLFPRAVKVEISVRASFVQGHVLDVEPGDATPAESVDWVIIRRKSGLDTPTVYCNLSTWPTVRNAFLSRRVPEPLYWIAHYDRQFNIPPGAIAKQYLPNFQGTDHSAVADFWPGVDGQLHPVANGDADMLDRISVPAQPTTKSIRLKLSGTATAGVILRVPEDGKTKEGYNNDAPIWVGDIFAWTSDRVGIGHNPTQLPGYNPKILADRRYDLPGAVWADVNYSCLKSFVIETY